MALLRPNQLPDASTPLNTVSDVLVLDQGTGGVTKVLIPTLTEAGIPIASQGEAEAGEINAKRMTPLRTKQAFDQFIDDADVVKFGEAQSLSPEQQEQARDNISALARDGSDVGDAQEQATLRRAIGADILPGFLCGFSITTNISDANGIDFGAGVCASAAVDPVRMVVGAMTKRADATFAEGSGNGGMVSGESLPTNGTIHLWAITKVDGTGDYCFNNHASSGLDPTLPDGFVHKRRIGSRRTDGSANIRSMITIGDENWYASGAGVLDVDVSNQGTSDAIRTLTVPLGIDGLVALTNTYINHADRYAHLLMRPAFLPTFTASVTNPPLSSSAVRVNASGASAGISAYREILVSTSGTIITSAGHSDTTLRIATLGWRDDLGRRTGFFT